MTQLSALPVLSVQIAFNPTNIQSTTQTWTDVTAYVRDFQTKAGKQHYLDRVQASTVSMTLNNRNGYFLNGTTNGTGSVISVRLPIKITATYSSTTYPVFYGLIDSIEEKIGDALNTDLVIQASDFIKYLSLTTLADLNFWKTNAVTSTGDIKHWYQPGQNPYTVTNAVVTSGTSIVFTCNNNFTVGEVVLVSGMTVPSGQYSINGSYTTTAVTATSFTVATTNPGTFTAQYQNGTAAPGAIVDLVSGAPATYVGLVAVPPSPPEIGYLNNGCLVYSTTTAVDLTTGTGVPTAGIQIPSSTNYGIEFWFLGNNLFNQTLLITGSTVLVSVSATGKIGTSHNVSDGYWHHVAINGNSGSLIVDGVVCGTAGTGSSYQIGMSVSAGPSASMYVDQIMVYNSNANDVYISQRYYAGSILQVPKQSTADRIAQVLVLTGFGTVSGAGYSVPNYYIGNSYQTYTAWTPNYSTGTLTEPYYWDNPVTTSTSLDLIQQVSDTEIGVLYQDFDGSFVFLDRNYFGTWSWNSTSKTGTWTLNPSISPSGNYVWTDDGTGIPYYGPTTQILRDDVDLWTSVQVNPQSGVPQLYANLSAEPRYGYSTLIKSATVNSSLDSALSTANYLGYLFGSPLARVGSVELRAETNNGSTIPAMLGAKIYDAIQFKRSSPGASTAGSVNLNMAVESISNNFMADPGQWHTTFILDPYPVRS